MSDSKVPKLIAPVQKIVDAVKHYVGGIFIWLFFKPLAILSVFLSLVFGVSYSSPIIGLVMLLVPTIAIILLFFLWHIFLMYLLFLFAIKAEERLGMMLIISVFVLPFLLICSTIDTLFFSVMTSEFSFWVYATIAIFSVLMIKRYFPFDWALKHINLSVHGMNVTMMILLLEILYPYPKSAIETSKIESCSQKKSISKAGVVSYNTECFVTIVVNGKARQIYLFDPRENVNIVHGLLFDHYR